MALFSFRRLDIDPLAVSMSGVKLGERLLQVGVDDAALAGLLASKTGLSGSAAHAVSTDAEAVKVNRGAKKAGVLIEVRVTPLDQLPYEAASFDVVVVHSAAGQLASADAAARLGGAARPAARGPSRGATGHDRAGYSLGPVVGVPGAPAAQGAYEGAGGTLSALRQAGFGAVRELGDREGLKFVEGLRAI